MENLGNSPSIVIDATNKYDTFYSEISTAGAYKKVSTAKKDEIEI